MTSEATEKPEVAVEFGIIEIASKTDLGLVRAANEDSCDFFERTDRARLLIVADGMGGHRGGSTASRTAVSIISECFVEDVSSPIEEMIRGAIKTANSKIFELAKNDPALEGMGTTVVVLVLDAENQATIAHVGDSRAYRYRQGQLDQLTQDHSVVAEMHRRGVISEAEARVHPRRNEILRSVGVLAEVEVEVAAVETSPGDRFLLCSDGLTGMVDDEQIAAVVQTETPECAVDRLVQMANAGGGSDNISVQILSLPSDRNAGDPEATAPIGVSTSGIEAIEAKRRQRKQLRVLAIACFAAAAAVGLYAAWLALGPSTDAPADRFEIEAESPRRGVPH
jgi:protein phosphatase